MQDVITINNYAEFEQKFDNVMQETAEKFVVIGYMLKVARDTDILRESGYTTMGEFAQKRYGLTKDIASRYIAINDRYSEGGYSEQLDPKYKAFGYAKLAEMLTLSDAVVEEISPDMTREDIRGIKAEVKAEEAISDIEVMIEEKDQGVEMEDSLIGKVLYQICHEQPEIFKKLWVAVNEESATIEELFDVLAPSGIAMISCRIPGTGRLMLSIKGIEENLQIINLRSNEKEEVTWEEFRQVAVLFLQTDSEDWKIAYWNTYNEEIPEEKPEVEPAQPKTERVVKAAPKKTPKKEPEKVEPAAVPEEQLPGQMEVEDYPELMPENTKGECDDQNKSEGNTGSIREKSGTDVSGTRTETKGSSEGKRTGETADRKVCGDTGRDPESVSGSGEQGKRNGRRAGTTRDEPETPQSNEESSEKENYEEVRQAARDRLDAVHAVFWGWENEKTIPKEELEMALKNAKNLVNAIEALILMTGE